jgi:hypothetical protein
MTMIERVGRALAEQERYAYDPEPYDARARAAVAALREPSDAVSERMSEPPQMAWLIGVICTTQ